MVSNELKKTTQQMLDLTVRLSDAIEANDYPKIPPMLSEFDARLNALNYFARKESPTFIEDRRSVISNEGNKLRQNPFRTPSDFKGAAIIASNLLRILQKTLDFFEGKLPDPANRYIIYALALVFSIYRYRIQANEERAAAILVTKEHEELFSGNSERSLPEYGRHAEDNALIQAIKKKYDVAGSTIFISSLPCYRKKILQLQTESNNVLTWKVVQHSDAQYMGQIITWKRAQLRMPKAQYWTVNFMPGVPLYEVYLDPERTKSEVYYVCDGVFLPKELRTYSSDVSGRYVEIEEGCAVMLAMTGIKQVFYLYYEELYVKAIDFIKERNVLIDLIEHVLTIQRYESKQLRTEKVDLFHNIMSKAKYPEVKNLDEMRQYVLQLCEELEISDPYEFMRKKFGIDFPELLKV